MAVGKISGVMLQSDLARDGTNLSFDSNLVYLDVTLRSVGINTTSPAYALDVNGTIHANTYTSAGNVTALYFIGDGSQLTNVNASSIGGNVANAEFAANAGYADLATYVTGNTQSNITAVGTLTNLTVADTITTQHLILNGGQLNNVNIGNLTFNDTTIGTSTVSANIILQPNGTGLVVIDSTSALQLPTGNTAQEPVNVTAGAIRYNSEKTSVEYFTGNSWVATTPSVSMQKITPDGLTNSWTLDHTATQEGIIVNLNGVIQQPGTAYTVSGTTITFTETPLTTDLIEIRFITAGVAPTSTGSLALISNVAPAHNNSAGSKGQVAYDSSYLYICVATNTWIRSSISTSF
jgi:hypothetical protein